MKYKIFLLFVGILLISFISASSIYAGDCLEVDLSELESLDNVVYDVVGNSSNLEGLTVDLNETTAIANICTVLNYKPDSFTIIFIDNSTNEIVKEVHTSSSGGTRTIYKDKNITTYVDKIIYKTNETEVIKIVPGEKQKFPWVFYLTVIGVLSAILIIVLTVEHLKSKKENEK